MLIAFTSACWHAHMRGVIPWAVSATVAVAGLRSSKASATSWNPCWIAMSSGVEPSEVADLLGSAPLSSNIFKMPTLPVAAATCSGVHPNGSM